MQVETYEVQDTPGTSEETNVEALALIDALGLEGQQRLVKKQDVGDGETVERRIPYRKMTLQETRVFKALFPTQVALVAYDREPIPLRVLQVAQHAISLGMEVHVWCPKDSRDVDPVLVGYHEPRQYDVLLQQNSYLLARWGAALQSLDDLTEKAAQRLALRVKQQVAEFRATLTEEAVDILALGYMMGDQDRFPAFHVSGL